MSASPKKRRSVETSDPRDLRLGFKNRAFLLAFFVLVVDQATKWIAVSTLSEIPTLAIVPGFFHFTLVYNPGVAFGWFAQWGFPVTLATIGVVALLLFSAWRRGEFRESQWMIPSALIVGGAIGNVIDRIRLGSVIDFLDFRIWPVFNVADSAITIGAFWMIFKTFRSQKRASNSV